MNEVDLAWASGLFEGEGTFCFQSTGIGSAVAIQMTDQDVLEKMKNLFGGKITVAYEAKNNWKTCYRWTLGIKDGSEYFVNSIYPYLMSRRQAKADEWIKSRVSVQQSRYIADERNKKVLEALSSGKTQKQVADEFDITPAYVSILLKRSR